MASPILAGLAALCLIAYLFFKKAKASAPLPPGPNPYPLIGNIFDLTRKELWLKATRWMQDYGDICYIHVFGKGIVVLNTAEAASNLLDKRGSIYSDKPHLVMAGDLCGCGDMVPFTGYGDQSKRHRRLMNRALSAQRINDYNPLVEIQTRTFLRSLTADPSEYMRHARKYAGGLTLNVIYGYEPTSHQDEFILLGEESIDILSNHISSKGGIWMVDVFPFLQNMPLWMPGSSFKHKAIKWKARIVAAVEKPFEWVKDSMAKGTAVPSFCSTLLEGERSVGDAKTFENDLKWTANSMFAASMDTTITSVSLFILAMIQNPEVVAKAQKELDSIVGHDRLPTFADRPHLPYVDALMSETLRWSAAVPLSLPHRLMQDDIYDGMLIPRGSLILANVWAMTRNEKLFPNPEAFIPERYLEKVDEETARRKDPRHLVFGFGRRKCPGNNLIESSLWLLIAAMLSTLDISKAVDDSGSIIEPLIDFNNSVFRQPDKFKCTLKPRSAQAYKVIMQTEGLI